MRLARGGLVAALVAMTGPAMAGNPIPRLEGDAVTPRAAKIQPLRTNTTLDGIVLACVEGEGREILQLHLYLTGDGPFLPKDSSADHLKAFPSAAISVDGRTFEAGVFFSERYAIVGDVVDGYPRLSQQLVTAMLTGSAMVLRFDLLQESLARPDRFDGEAVIDLRSNPVGSSIGIGRCIAKPSA